MSDNAQRTAIANATAQGLTRFAACREQSPVMLGFDGFVDSIISVVDRRTNAEHYEPMPTIETFGKRIIDAAGNSANFEFVVKLQKLGGNGPIMANAMASAGLPVTYIGAVGQPTLHPVFEELAKRAQVHAISSPGFTDAVEFDDGKLMLGKHSTLTDVNYQQLIESLGRANFLHIVARSRLVGMVNWTMLSQMETIWQGLIEDILPDVDSAAERADGYIFIDLCDPAKRSVEDLQRAMSMCTKMNTLSKVILGLNLAEALQVARAAGASLPTDPESQIESLARDIREALGLHCVVVHPRAGAAAARCDDDGVTSASFAGPFVAKPKLSTGAGDNFNAGFCLGMLADLPVDQCLCVGTATSGFYVRQAKSPTLEELVAFCRALPDPQSA